MEASAATPETTSSTTTRHSREVRSLRHDLPVHTRLAILSWQSKYSFGEGRTNLDVTTLEHALVKDEGLGNKAGLGELDVGITANQHVRSSCQLEKGTGSCNEPLGLASELVQENGDSVD